MKKYGFTLVEIMVVVAIMGLLAAVVIPAFIGEKEPSYSVKQSPPLYNDYMIEQHRVEKLFEINGYDVYSFFGSWCLAVCVGSYY